MATSKLDEIRAKLEAMDNSSGKKTSNLPQGDNAIYPFWNIQEGESVSMRFLPDSDPNNTFFWAERQMIRLKFPGVVGGENKPVTVQVPCGEMYGDTCSVLTEVRPWFKVPSMEDMGREYWKKRSYIFQGFVNDSPLQEEAPENPIRRFVIGPQIFNIIKAALMDPDMENIPTDYMNGTDFRLCKSSKGQYADYSTSSWARRERALNETELSAIDQHGLFTLGDFLPARPTQEHYQAISEMFAASVNGDLYDPARWGNYYKPYGVEVPASATQPSTASAQPAPVTELVATPAPAPAPVTAAAPAQAGKKSADDILAMIRNRAGN